MDENTIYAIKMYEKLRELSPESDKNDWFYVGGNMEPRITYWKQRYGNREIPQEESYCLCGHSIKENCYISTRKNTNIVAILGNCCIKKYLPIENQGKTCEKCRQPHRNRKDNLCSECRREKEYWDRYFYDASSEDSEEEASDDSIFTSNLLNFRGCTFGDIADDPKNIEHLEKICTVNENYWKSENIRKFVKWFNENYSIEKEK